MEKNGKVRRELRKNTEYEPIVYVSYFGADDVMSRTNREGYMRIGELAKATNMTTSQIRVYEKIGIIHPSSQTPGGHHLYAPHTVVLLQRVLRLKESERRTLVEIRDILNPKVV